MMKDAWGGSRVAQTKGAEISLSDNGVGIPDEIAEKLFDPFFTTKDSSSGSGFGLYNSKLFIEDHNGEIGFSSIVGKRSTFYLFIPLAEEEDRDIENQRNSKRASREFVKRRKGRS